MEVPLALVPPVKRQLRRDLQLARPPIRIHVIPIPRAAHRQILAGPRQQKAEPQIPIQGELQIRPEPPQPQRRRHMEDGPRPHRMVETPIQHLPICPHVRHELLRHHAPPAIHNPHIAPCQHHPRLPPPQELLHVVRLQKVVVVHDQQIRRATQPQALVPIPAHAQIARVSLIAERRMRVLAQDRWEVRPVRGVVHHHNRRHRRLAQGALQRLTEIGRSVVNRYADGHLVVHTPREETNGPCPMPSEN